MNAKIKLVIGVAAAVIIMNAAYAAYQNLRTDYQPDIAITASEQPDDMEASLDSSQNAPQNIAAVDFTMLDQNGQTVKLSDYYGKPIVLNFWATWCGYCVEEMPHFDKLSQEMGDEVQFLMVNLTTDGETVDKASAFIAKHGYQFPVFYDTNGEAARGYGIMSLPTTYFIDAQGNVIGYYPAMIDEENLRKIVDEIKQD